MRLNPDCIRDILLYVEENSTFTNAICINRQNPPKEFHEYSYDELLYHISQCSQSGFLNGFSSYDNGDTVLIGDLTPKAHEFLANIRNNEIWSKVKSTAKQVGVDSLKALMSIAVQIASQVISHHFG